MNKKIYPMISMVTTCKGRLHFLQRSLPTWLKQDYTNFEIVIVDFDCPQKTAEYIENNRQKLLKNSKAVDLRVIRVFPRPYFNLNEARNVGCQQARGSIIFLIDADVAIRRKNLLKDVARMVLAGKEFITNVLVLSSLSRDSRNYYRYFLNGLEINKLFILPFSALLPDLAGTVVFLKERYQQTGGFNEEISRYGWGYDDIEFYLRYLNCQLIDCHSGEFVSCLNQQLSKVAYFPENSFKNFVNTEQEKSQFQQAKKSLSREKNQLFLQQTIANLEGKLPAVDPLRRQKVNEVNHSEMFRGWLYWRVAHGAYLKGFKLIAEEYFQKLANFELYAGRAFYFLNRLKPHRKMHYLLKAIKSFEKNVQSDDYDLLYFALTKKELGIYEEALKLFRKIFRTTVNLSIKASAAFHLAEILIFKKRLFLAKKYLQFVLVIIPGHNRAKQYLEGIKEGK